MPSHGDPVEQSQEDAGAGGTGPMQSLRRPTEDLDADSSAPGSRQPALDLVLADHRAQLAQIAGDRRARNAVDDGHVARLERGDVVDDCA